MKYKYWIFIGIILVVGMTPLFWFKGDLLINGGDFGFNLNPKLVFMQYVSSWSDRISTGFPNAPSIAQLFPYQAFLVFCQLIGLSLVSTEKILFSLLFIISGLSMYYLTSVFLKGEGRELASLISAVAYMLNPFTLIVLWGTPTLGILYYPFIPLLLVLYFQIINNNNTKIYFPIICIVLLLSSIQVNMAFVITTWLLFLSLLFFFAVLNRRDRAKIAHATIATVLLFIIWFLMNTWWLFSYLSQLRDINAAVTTYMVSADFLKSSSRDTGFLNIFRMQGYWPFYEKHIGVDPYYRYASVYLSPIFIIISFLLPVMTFISVLFREKNRFFVFYFSILAIILIFLIKGSHSPFGQPLLWVIENIPLAAALRNPQSKLGPLLVLSYSFLIGFTFRQFFYKCKNIKLNKKLLKITIIFIYVLIFGVFNWPFWSGYNMFIGNGTVRPGWRMKLPEYYIEAYEWLEQQKENLRIFPIPLPDFGGVAYNWQYGYFGSDPSFWIFDKPTLGWHANVVSRLVWDQFKDDSLQANIVKILGVLNVKYLLLHRDFKMEYFGKEPVLLKKYLYTLQQQEGVTLEKTFGKLDFYKVSNEYFLPHIYPAANPILINGSVDDMFRVVTSHNFSIGNDVLFVSDQNNSSQWEFLRKYGKVENSYVPIITFQKINPTRYDVEVKNATHPFFIVFSESYNPQWKAYIKDKSFVPGDVIAYYENVNVKEVNHGMKFTPGDVLYLFKESVNDDEHFLANGYANAWYIDPKETGRTDFVITLYFKPQSYFYLGLFISGFTLISCFGYLLYYWYKFRKQNKITQVKICGRQN